MAGKTTCPFKSTELVSSLESKAGQTAKLVSEQLGLSYRAYSGLHENDRSGFPFFADKKHFQDKLREFFSKYDSQCVGTESAKQAFSRFNKAVKEVVAARPGKNIGVVAHGTVISLFVAQYNGISPFELWKSLSLPSYLILDLPSFRQAREPVNF